MNEEEVALEFQLRYEEDDGKLEKPTALAPSIAILIIPQELDEALATSILFFATFCSVIKHFWLLLPC